MPTVRLIAFKYYTLLISFIALDSEIISSCSYYAKKELVYIVIAEPSNYQPSFCSKCTKLNTRVLYNVRSVSLNKCTPFTYFNSL